MMDSTSTNLPYRVSRLSSSSSASGHSRRNGHKAPQDNGNHSLKPSRGSRRYREGTSRSSSDTSHSRRRRSSNGSNKTTPTQQDSSSSSGGTFAKWAITVVIFIAIADLMVLWTSIDTTIGDQNGDRPHQIGPEMGLHQLVENRSNNDIRLQLINDVIKKQQQQNDMIKEQQRQAKLQYPKKVRKYEEERRRHEHEYKPFQKVKNIAKVDKVKNTNTYGVDEHIVNILTAANIQLDEELASQLPTWDDILSMYGDGPIIYGLETCQTYRDTVKPEDRMLGPAGIFNTGTNLLFELMKANCNIKEARTSKTHKEPTRNGMRFQPPWGKHNPPSTHREQHVAKFWGEGINQTAFFPVVLIKDFYHWAGSQCRHSYTSWWEHDKDHCPNLVDASNRPNRLVVRYGKGAQYYDGLLGLWNGYYQEWEQQTFPHLTTRYEDLLFHGEAVTKIACDCVGGEFTTNFGYVEGSAKENGLPIHNGANGLVKALLQYGSISNRLAGFTDRDRIYASKELDSSLAKKFNYIAPPLPT